jgi:putative Holliday junction resolvase
VGKARVGVARCDREGLLATPVETLAREIAIEAILDMLRVEEFSEVVVGLPINLRGERTASTEDAQDFAQQLAQAQSVPIRLVDERLTTVQASQGLRAAGKSAKNQRGMVDQAAAVILLQHALDAERHQWVAPGQLLAAGTNDND